MNYAFSTTKESGHGWRISYFDSNGYPVASFWALTRHEAKRMASVHVRNVS